METLRFRPGDTSTTVRGMVVGRFSANYRFDVGAGQVVSLRLNAKNKNLLFSLRDPRGRTVADDQTRWSDRLRVPGTYQVRIYLTREEARRNKFVPFSLDVRIEGRDGGRPEPLPQPGRETYRVVGVAVDDTLNMRSRPEPRARVVAEIPFDATGLRGLGCVDDNSWCQVRYRGQEGWVAARFLRRE
jgi:hypothetical protein